MEYKTQKIINFTLKNVEYNESSRRLSHRCTFEWWNCFLKSCVRRKNINIDAKTEKENEGNWDDLKMLSYDSYLKTLKPKFNNYYKTHGNVCILLLHSMVTWQIKSNTICSLNLDSIWMSHFLKKNILYQLSYFFDYR